MKCSSRRKETLILCGRRQKETLNPPIDFTATVGDQSLLTSTPTIVPE
jgi:hypothetical protein